MGISLHSLDTSERVCRNAKSSDLKVLTILTWRTQLLPSLKDGVPAARSA